jgi:membrane-bound lytic murein transglycosylase F
VLVQTRVAIVALLLLLLSMPLTGCSKPSELGSERAETPPPDVAPQPELWTDDLPGMRERGELRILVQRRSAAWLPRDGSPQDADRSHAERLAEALGVSARFVAVENFEDLIPALLAGRGDLIVENFTVTDERRKRVRFSSPVELVREQIVTRADDAALADLPDLAGRRLAVQRSTSFFRTAQELAEKHPGLEIETAPENLDLDELLDGVATGRFDLTLMDSNVMAAAARWRDDLRVAIDLRQNHVIAWAMRPDAPLLRKNVDTFLARSAGHAGDRERRLYTDDLPGLTKRGVLRVITRNSSSTYFITRGELVGFEYDLARHFAEQLGLRIEIVVPPSRDDLFRWLLEGRGDIIAAGLTASPERAAQEGVAFSRMMQEVRETVVTRLEPTRPAPGSIEELAGRTLAVRRSSAYWETLDALRRDGIDLQIVAVPENLETEQIIARVGEGEYEMTVADTHILAIEQTWRDDIRSAFPLGDPIAHGWAVRPDNPKLLAAIDAFFDKEYRGLFYNVTHDKYFGNPTSIEKRLASRPMNTGWISPYDDLVRRHAAPFGFDWRLIVAQMFQESRFNPKARSFAGARGLLQVMPRTARELGYTGLEDPETGIRAGVDYLAWVRERFDADLSAADRTWLTLAAYNVGAGHVRDAQRIAVDQGLDPDRWFGNVEQALLLKQKPEFHRKTRYGYARASEPVAYVRAIRDRYQAYVQAEPQAEVEVEARVTKGSDSNR